MDGWAWMWVGFWAFSVLYAVGMSAVVICLPFRDLLKPRAFPRPPKWCA